VDYYAANEAAGRPQERPHGWAGRGWSPATGVEHRATREAAGLFDETSFAKLSVTGSGAAAFLERVYDNRVARAVGQVTYTQALNSRAGIESDVTVTRTAPDAFLVVTGTAFGGHDLAWLRLQARSCEIDVRLSDVSGQYACFALWGPRSRKLLAGLTAADLGPDAFRFMTAQQITVGDVPVLALRVTFVGELGWELYAPVEYGRGLWQALWDAGRDVGLLACGYRAIDSLRLEKGYRVWSTDLTPETTPDEAGLQFCVRLDKPGGFVGAQVLRQRREEGQQRRLCCLTLADPRQVVLGGEPVLAGGRPVGRVTSGGYGYTVQASIAYAYLPVELAAGGTPVQVELFGEQVDAVVAPDVLYDPDGARIRS
jgi:glycine cleavage system aminomethyltransferase T